MEAQSAAWGLCLQDKQTSKIYENEGNLMLETPVARYADRAYFYSSLLIHWSPAIQELMHDRLPPVQHNLQKITLLASMYQIRSKYVQKASLKRALILIKCRDLFFNNPCNITYLLLHLLRLQFSSSRL